MGNLPHIYAEDDQEDSAGADWYGKRSSWMERVVLEYQSMPHKDDFIYHTMWMTSNHIIRLDAKACVDCYGLHRYIKMKTTM